MVLKTTWISCSVNMSFAHFSGGLPVIFLFVGALYVEINPLPVTSTFFLDCRLSFEFTYCALYQVKVFIQISQSFSLMVSEFEVIAKKAFFIKKEFTHVFSSPFKILSRYDYMLIFSNVCYESFFTCSN